MNRVHFNKYERVAGIFILVAIGGAAVSALSIAVKQGWFDPKVTFRTTFENAEGVHAGTTVKIAGLNAGSVEDVELLEDNRVRVTFNVLGKFADRVREDSHTLLIRPFIIGDRVLEVTVGTQGKHVLAERAELSSEENTDLMTFMSGQKMGQAMKRMSLVMDNLQSVLDAFTNKERMTSLVRMFDQMEPLLNDLSTMTAEVTKLSKQVTHDQNLPKVLAQVSVLTKELNRIVPAMTEANPELGHDMASLAKSLGRVSSELDQALNQIGPEMPGTAKRAVEALNEATVLIKAMQKSFFVRGSVREVREEEADRADRDAKRQPAKESSTPKPADKLDSP